LIYRCDGRSDTAVASSGASRSIANSDIRTPFIAARRGLDLDLALPPARVTIP
jgi:hypothetical protein